MPEKRRKFDEDFRVGAVRIVYEAMIAKTCTRDAFEVVLARGATDERAALPVATRDGTLEGYLDFGPDEDGVLELRRLYTAVGRTGQGVGAALVEALDHRGLDFDQPTEREPSMMIRQTSQ